MKLLRPLVSLTVAVLCLDTASRAAVFSFTTDPFAGSTALSTPGRQVVGGESMITFAPASDVFALDGTVFGLSAIGFVNAEIGSVPASGVNTVVLRTFDNDANVGTPFNAGTAADLIANQITSSGPGLFIYFNQGLDLPRLVYSTDLSDNTSDLKILARLTNLTGQSGRDALASFSAANFQILPPSVPESASFLTLVLAAGFLAASRRLFGRSRN